MDNASFHKVASVKNAFTTPPVTCVQKFIPAFSPQLNPIEEVFSLFKGLYRKSRPRPKTTEEVIQLVENLAIQLSIEDFSPYYLHMRQFLKDAENKKSFPQYLVPSVNNAGDDTHLQSNMLYQSSLSSSSSSSNQSN